MNIETVANKTYHIRETETATAAQAAAPENVLTPKTPVEVGYNGETKTLQERIQLRNQLSQMLHEAVEAKDLDDIKENRGDFARVRYALQNFSNGGTPYVDENGIAKKDGETGGPSQYERWRKEMNDKKRKARMEAERDEMTSSFVSPKTTTQDWRKTLDGQCDEFMSWYVDKYGNQEFEDPTIARKIPITGTITLKESQESDPKAIVDDIIAVIKDDNVNRDDIIEFYHDLDNCYQRTHKLLPTAAMFGDQMSTIVRNLMHVYDFSTIEFMEAIKPYHPEWVRKLDAEYHA